MNRSAGVTVIAGLVMIGSVLTLLVGLLMLAVMMWAPVSPSAQFPGSPVFMKLMFAALSVMYILPAIWGILTSVGLFRLKNWARISTIVFSVLLIVISAFPVLLTLAMPIPQTPGGAADPAVMTGIRIAMGVFWLVQLGIGIWWLVFFTRPKVKLQFVPAQPLYAGGVPLPEVGVTQFAPPVLARGGVSRPLSITIIAWFLLAGCFFLPLSLLLHAPVVFFTKLLAGKTAVMYQIILISIQVGVGVGLLRLRPAARIGGIAYLAFGFLSGAVFYFAPGGHARMLALFESERSMFPWMRTLPAEQSFRPEFIPLFPFFAVLGLCFVMVPIYFLLARKAAFEGVSREQ
jgi:hypothetical protein